MLENEFDVLIVGGGAAGFFAAINCAELNPSYKIGILERGQEVLSKVRISGGGRCNVTHACFDPKTLTSFYPRGNKALRGPFSRFSCQDTIDWFSKRGVETHIEKDGRVFPESNDSQTIVDCLLDQTEEAGIILKYGHSLNSIHPPSEKNPLFQIKTLSETTFSAKKLMIATGSNSRIWNLLNDLGHTIIDPVPSLFTFNIKDSRIEGLSGLSMPLATVKIPGTKLKTEGPVLITHWGMSGPAILKMSAVGAREFHEKKYSFQIIINWLNTSIEDVKTKLIALKESGSQKKISNERLGEMPSRLWNALCEKAGIDSQKKYLEVTNKSIQKLAMELCEGRFHVEGKSTFKEEFVTAGGVTLKEVDFKRFESKIHPGMFFAGEVLDIDAVTGGFNFQAAWTGAYLVAQSM